MICVCFDDPDTNTGTDTTTIRTTRLVESTAKLVIQEQSGVLFDAFSLGQVGLCLIHQQSLIQSDPTGTVFCPWS